jgi:hypothetical protein
MYFWCSKTKQNPLKLIVRETTSKDNVLRKGKGADKVVPVHNMKTYSGPGGTTLHTLTSALEDAVTFTIRRPREVPRTQ